MGLFDFFRRDHGEKVSDSDAPTADELKSHLSQVGLPTNGLDIQVADDTVTVRGSAAYLSEFAAPLCRYRYQNDTRRIEYDTRTGAVTVAE